MADVVSEENFSFKFGHIPSTEDRNTDYFLLLITREDYNEIIKGLINLTKQRARSREYKQKKKESEDDKDKNKLKTEKKNKKLSHQAKLRIIANDLDLEEARTLAIISEKKYKEGLPSRLLFKTIANEMDKTEKDRRKSLKEDSDDESASESAKIDEKPKKVQTHSTTKTSIKKR